MLFVGMISKSVPPTVFVDTVFPRITNSRHEMFSRGVNTPPERDLKTCVGPSLRERVTCMCGEIGRSSGSRVFIQNCKVVPMGKNAGVNQVKFLKILGQTLGLEGKFRRKRGGVNCKGRD